MPGGTLTACVEELPLRPTTNGQLPRPERHESLRGEPIARRHGQKEPASDHSRPVRRPSDLRDRDVQSRGQPVKDGVVDHFADQLRYAVVGRRRDMGSVGTQFLRRTLNGMAA